MWTCTVCGEVGPEDVGLCWSCRTPRGEVVFVSSVAELEEEGVSGDAAAAPASAGSCVRCDSLRVMEDLPVVGPASGAFAYPSIEVEVTRHPHPLFTRGSVRGEVYARVCADCGHTELFTLGAKRLWDAWQMLRTPPRPASPPTHTPQSVLDAARGKRSPPLTRSEHAEPSAAAPTFSHGAAVEFRAARATGAARGIFPLTGHLISVHADPAAGEVWWLCQFDQPVNATMQIGDASRYQRVEADACLFRGGKDAPTEFAKWIGVEVEFRFVSRGAWTPGKRVSSDGVLPVIAATCHAREGA